MLHGCKKLLFLSEVTKWNVNEVVDIGSIFEDRSFLSSLPDISK